jgi:glycerol uptake facilitator-like aquaporin
MVANVTFAQPPIAVSTSVRDGVGQLASEAACTVVLVLVILNLVRTGRSEWVPAAVGAWAASVILSTASGGFANPAVTVARTLTDTSMGIAPESAIRFVAVQLTAGVAAAAIAGSLDKARGGPSN